MAQPDVTLNGLLALAHMHHARIHALMHSCRHALFTAGLAGDTLLSGSGVPVDSLADCSLTGLSSLLTAVAPDTNQTPVRRHHLQDLKRSLA